METRCATFNGWQMNATVEKRSDLDGNAWYYIVSPVTYREFATHLPQQPATEIRGPFRDIDRAFSAAFSDCAREIDREIDARARNND